MSLSAIGNILLALLILGLAVWVLLDGRRPPVPTHMSWRLRDMTIVTMAVLSVVSSIGSLYPAEGPEREAVRFAAGLLRGVVLTLLLGLIWHRHQERRS